jgi:NitT/TauT family transport system ATP-binding protein
MNRSLEAPTSLYSGSTIELRGVNKVFGRTQGAVEALKDITFAVDQGELISIIGPSGCGKSTILNLISGLMKETSGVVLFEGARVTKVNNRVGYMTQRDTLVPWRTARQNIVMPLEIRGVAKKSRESRASEMIELMGLEGFGNHYPSELSGGMRQRVNLARTLIYQPHVLLMDEPFAALDAQTRLMLQAEFSRLFEELGQTAVFVTHDILEAIALSDRVMVMSRRPGTIIAETAVPISRPRDVTAIPMHSSYAAIYRDLADLLNVMPAGGRARRQEV